MLAMIYNDKALSSGQSAKVPRFTLEGRKAWVGDDVAGLLPVAELNVVFVPLALAPVQESPRAIRLVQIHLILRRFRPPSLDVGPGASPRHILRKHFVRREEKFSPGILA